MLRKEVGVRRSNCNEAAGYSLAPLLIPASARLHCKLMFYIPAIVLNHCVFHKSSIKVLLIKDCFLSYDSICNPILSV